MRRGLLWTAVTIAVLAGCSSGGSRGEQRGAETTIATTTTSPSRTTSTTAAGTVRVTTRHLLHGSTALTVRIIGWTGATGGGWPQGLFHQEATTGCRRMRVLGGWHLASTAGAPKSYPQARVDLSTTPNRLGVLEWTDRGSGDGTTEPDLQVGRAISVVSPWFDITSPDPITVQVTLVGASDRGTPHIDDHWSIDRLDLECEELGT